MLVGNDTIGTGRSSYPADFEAVPSEDLMWMDKEFAVVDSLAEEKHMSC